ncbi:MAG: aldehyde ferredoxin oxidoreductase family protein [Candidatus Riflebacteria bacterium]|nr:aldehyde ferredoxin oxidoreductase family protein [Candidatus Riflebacteria bacterium]
MLTDDTIGNILYIDLSKKDYRIEKRADLFDRYIGGAGVAAALLSENCPEGIDALAPENPIILAVGPLTGMFPIASKTVAMFKSPHTGNLGESHCGGRSAVAIRMAGLGAIVISGKSDIPVFLNITGSKVEFHDATTLWGMSQNQHVGRILRGLEGSEAGVRTIMRIGKAGEKLISYACVTSETYRHFGRLGLGAVFGSKMLKALIIGGRSSLKLEKTRDYIQVYDEVFKAATESPLMKKYHDLGTAENVLPLSEKGGLPTRNLQSEKFEHANEISGEAFAEKTLARRLACAHCPVACIHLSSLREPYEDEPYFYRTSFVAYDYELIFALGSFLGVANRDDVLKLIDRVERWGLDVMSTGVILGWVTEAYSRGLINDSHTGDLKPTFGDAFVYLSIIDRIVEQPNDFYKALAKGVEYASSVYGGSDFAMAFGKNEMPGYHTGPGAHVGFTVGARHSHLDNGGYGIDQKDFLKGPLTPEQLAGKILAEEEWRQILSSLTICFFARSIYTPEMVQKTLATLGFNFDKDALLKLGREIHRMKYAFKYREGFDLSKCRLPARIFETPTPAGMIDEKFVRDTVEAFRKLVLPVAGKD